MRIRTELSEMPPAFTVAKEETKAVITFYEDVSEIVREDGTSYSATAWTAEFAWTPRIEQRVAEHTETWRQFVKVQCTAEAAASVRKERNRLLAESDERMTLDRFGISTPSGSTFTAWLTFLRSLGSILTGEWARYRQSLRDLPTQEGFPFDVEFPKKPEV